MCATFQNPIVSSLYSVTVKVDNPQGQFLLQKLVPSFMYKRKNFSHSHIVLIKRLYSLHVLVMKQLKMVF